MPEARLDFCEDMSDTAALRLMYTARNHQRLQEVDLVLDESRVIYTYLKLYHRPRSNTLCSLGRVERD